VSANCGYEYESYPFAQRYMECRASSYEEKNWNLACLIGVECDMLLVEEKKIVLGTTEKRYWEKSKAEKYIIK
jgi:hypothetical protein